MIIIGIDPGSRRTGYGVIRFQQQQSVYIASGCLKVEKGTSQERLHKIFISLQDVIQLYQPQEAAIEQIFMHQNPGSALKLGQARGAAMVALTIPTAEYSARQVKQSVVGYGAAVKSQVQHMVKKLLNLSILLQADEADALAVALCHAHSRSSLYHQLAVAPQSKRKSSWRNFCPQEG